VRSITPSTVISLKGRSSRKDLAAASIARSASSGVRRRRGTRPALTHSSSPSWPILYSLVDTASIDTVSIISTIRVMRIPGEKSGVTRVKGRRFGSGVMRHREVGKVARV